MWKASRLLDGLVKYTLAAIMIAVPLYPKFPFIRIEGTFVAIRLEDVLLLFAAIVLLIIYLSRIREFIKDKINLSILLYLSIGFISLVSAVFLTKTVGFNIGFLHWVRRIEYFIPFFLGLEAIKRRKVDLAFYINILLIVMLGVFIYGAGQRYFGWPIIITQNEENSKGIALRWLPQSHINSTFAGHYDLASFLVLILPLLISYFFIFKDKLKRIILLTGVLSGLWLLVNTASRISLASYLFAITITLFLIKKYRAIPVVIITSIIFISFSTNLLSRYVRIIQVVKEDVKQFNLLNYETSVSNVYALEEDILSRRKTPSPTPTPLPVLEDRSTNIRLNVEWPRAIRAYLKNPLLGTGYSSITLATDNDYLRLLGEVGILGFIAFFMIFVNIFNKILKSYPWIKNKDQIESVFVVSMIGSFPGLLVNALFIDIFEASKFAIIFWLFMGITVGLCKE